MKAVDAVTCDEERRRLTAMMENASTADFIELKRLLLGDPGRNFPLDSLLINWIERYLQDKHGDTYTKPTCEPPSF